MSKRLRCVVFGTGRMAGGFVAPALAEAGWSTLLVGRERSVIDAIAARGELRLRTSGAPGAERRVGQVSALAHDDPRLEGEIATADLVATAVGPGALGAVGRLLAGSMRRRLDAGRPVNVVTFENHRRAPELLTHGLLDAEPSLAHEIGRRLGIGGAAVWRAIATRSLDADGVRYDADEVDECHVDAMALLHGLPPHDGSLPALRLTDGFDSRMVEKLWFFNAGHAAAAYLGWAAGCATLAEAMAVDNVRSAVAAVVSETAVAFAAHLRSRSPAQALPARDPKAILARYADPALADPVTRVAREPRRKLAPDDRLIAPALACLAVGRRPTALAAAAAAALAYAEPSDPQASDLRSELDHFGPAETLVTISGLHPGDELSQLICDEYRQRLEWERKVPIAVPILM